LTKRPKGAVVIYSGHHGYLDDIAATVREVELRLRPHKQRFDFMAVTGMSGALVGSPVSIRLHKPLVVLRKEGEACHSRQDLINCAAVSGRYLILDDFVSFGTTYDRIRQRFDEMEFAASTRYAGVYLYSDQVLSWDGDGTVSYMPKKTRRADTSISVDGFAPDDDRDIRADLKASFEKLRDDLDALGKTKTWTDVLTS
jgi:hypothetical protein